MQIISEGSVRVDLLGGTLDLWPINLILPNVTTLNLATTLKAKVIIEKNTDEVIAIESLDYQKSYQFKLEELTTENIYLKNYFAEMSFIIQILNYFNIKQGIKLTLSSGSPAGAGLGGSSTMGITLFRGLCNFLKKPFNQNEALEIVRNIEARILDAGPTGYQDYYPACYGGVLSLKVQEGAIDPIQLYSKKLSDHLENSLTLVYSGVTRNSGINNWEVYKGFFDKDENIRKGLSSIADLSHRAHRAIQENKFEELNKLIKEEGELRAKLFPGIVPKTINKIYADLLNEFQGLGLKMCGAGGGGCFLLIHKMSEGQDIKSRVQSLGMKVLDFKVSPPM